MFHCGSNFSTYLARTYEAMQIQTKTKTPITIPIIVNVLSFFKAAWSAKKKKKISQSYIYTHVLLNFLKF